MNMYPFDPSIPNDQILEMGATPVDTLADLFQYQFVSLHARATEQTKVTINKSLLFDDAEVRN